MYRITVTFDKPWKWKFNKCFSYTREDVAQEAFFSLVGLRGAVIQMWRGSSLISSWPHRRQPGPQYIN